MGNTSSTILHRGDGYTYCGEVVYKKQKWLAHGSGCYESKEYTYTGTFKQNQVSGRGTCTYASGVVYSGTWKTGFKHGKGKLVFPEGDYYEGGFAFDKINGKGKYVYVDGTYYIGAFCNGDMSGKGKLYSNTGKKLYSGEWLHDVFHGQGKYYYLNGAIQYQGQWKNSKANGYGMLQDKTGKVWCGTFKNGEFVGEGGDRGERDSETSTLPTMDSLALSLSLSSSDSVPTIGSICDDAVTAISTPEKMAFQPCSIRKKEVIVLNPIYRTIVIPDESSHTIIRQVPPQVVVTNPLMNIPRS